MSVVAPTTTSIDSNNSSLSADRSDNTVFDRAVSSEVTFPSTTLSRDIRESSPKPLTTKRKREDDSSLSSSGVEELHTRANRMNQHPSITIGESQRAEEEYEASESRSSILPWHADVLDNEKFYSAIQLPSLNKSINEQSGPTEPPPKRRKRAEDAEDAEDSAIDAVEQPATSASTYTAQQLPVVSLSAEQESVALHVFTKILLHPNRYLHRQITTLELQKFVENNLPLEKTENDISTAAHLAKIKARGARRLQKLIVKLRTMAKNQNDKRNTADGPPT